MNRRRIFVYATLICLPAALLIAVGGWLVAKHVPKSIRYEPSRIGREYREIAENAIERPETARKIGDRHKGWRQVSRINGVPWGYVANGETTTVWFQNGAHDCRTVEVKALQPFPYALVFYWGGGLAGLVLIGLSALAVWCFVRFMRERDDFLAATAHDLTTPLVGMRRMIGRDDETAKRLNERMLLIVGNIREFLRIGGRRKPPEPRETDLVRLSREAYALFAADYEESESGAVAFREPETETLPVLADETMTLQILWNLFGNDLKYAAPFGKVEVRFGREGRMAVVEFADEGQGMTKRQMRRAFDRYYRAKTVLASGKGGFGIGLCTAREFARAMGGELTVKANEPTGCVFTLSLPAAE